MLTSTMLGPRRASGQANERCSWRAVLYGLSRTGDPLGDRVLETASAVAATVARELAVEIEVAHRLRAIAQQQRDESNGPSRFDPREIREELIAIAIARATSDRS